jgi:SAM-dependent methyltransferase
MSARGLVLVVVGVLIQRGSAGQVPRRSSALIGVVRRIAKLDCVRGRHLVSDRPVSLIAAVRCPLLGGSFLAGSTVSCGNPVAHSRKLCAVRDQDKWLPTKFELHSGHWRGSRDPEHLAVTSRLTADLAMRSYAAAVSQYASGCLLDLGCGHVPLFGLYRKHADSVMCMDWPSTLHPSPHVDAVADLTADLPVRSQRFDTVILTDVLEHIPNPGHLVAEIARVLRPRGHLIAGVPFMYEIHEEPHDYYRYTEYRLRQLCADEALDVVFLAPYGDGVHSLVDQLVKQGAGRALFRLPILAVTWGALRRPPRPCTSRPLGYTFVARKA